MGTAKFTMRNWDTQHEQWLYTYEFTGFDGSSGLKVQGIHHVSPAQCGDAWWSWFWGLPATIGKLHNSEVKILQCRVGPNGPVTNRIPGEYRSEEVSRPAECGSNDGGGGDSSTCHTIITDHYWYYPDTGEYEYRFSTTETYCEMV